MQGSLCRAINPDAEDEEVGHATPFTSAEDEVFGLHPMPEIDSIALQKQGTKGGSLAARIRWEAASEVPSKQPVASVSLGRVCCIYAAGFATDVYQFLAKSTPSGKRLQGREVAFCWPYVCLCPI